MPGEILLRRRVTPRRLFSIVLAAFLTIASAPAPVYSDVPAACDTCSDGSGGGTENAGGSANVPFATFVPSGSESSADLDAACDGTAIEMEWSVGTPGEIDNMTYLFQITDQFGNIVDEQTGWLGDVGNPNGWIRVTSHVPIPVGGSVSVNVNLSGSSYNNSAGALFTGVQTPKC